MEPYYQDEWCSIYHGDCREERAWLDADVVISDPPYGMAFKSGMGGAFGTSEIVNDEDTTARDEMLAMWGDKPALIFGKWSVPRPKGTLMVLTWEKGNHVGMGDLSIPWKPNTEEIYVLGRGFEGHRGSSVLRYNAIAGTVGRADQGSRYHPTEKPVSVITDLLAKCPKDWVVVDPFMGSGTTLVAARKSGMRSIGVEVKEEYCAVAKKRIAQGGLFEGFSEA